MTRQRIDILLYSDCLCSEAFAVRDTLSLCDQFNAPGAFDLHVTSVGGRAVRAGGVQFQPEPASKAPSMLIVPGLMGANSASLIASCERLDAERAHIAAVARRGARIGAICVGAFLAASAGVLKGRRVTTAWPVADALHRWRADLTVSREHMVLIDGPVVTTGAMTAAYDLALALVTEVHGGAAAQRLRKFLALDGDRSDQRRYEAALAGARQSDPLVERAQRALQATLNQGYDLAKLARKCAASERTLLRRFKSVTGESPLAYRQSLVVETVKSLLETRTLALSQIPHRVGYADEVSLRRLFRTRTGMTFRDYRRRFGLLPAHRGPHMPT
jgi:transcriptional regulator GlxA family with amidase domain